MALILVPPFDFAENAKYLFNFAAESGDFEFESFYLFIIVADDLFELHSFFAELLFKHNFVLPKIGFVGSSHCLGGISHFVFYFAFIVLNFFPVSILGLSDEVSIVGDGLFG